MAEDKEQSIELILVKMGLLDQEGLIQAAQIKKKHPEKSLEDILLEEQIITEFDLIRAMGVKHNLPLVNLATQKISLKVLRYISEEDARKNYAIPVHEKEYVLYIASNNPFNHILFEKISQISGKQVSVLLATKRDIVEAINQSYIKQNVTNVMSQIEAEFGEGEEEADQVFDFGKEEVKANSIVRAVSIILEQAYRRRASDIHIEPMDEMVVVRIRIDGQLVETMSFAKSAFSHLLSRLKVMGGLDIAEKRVPQDGRMSVILGGEKVNMRVSTLPTVYGEKVVIRILGTSNPEDIMEIEDLDLEPYNYELLMKAVGAPNGIILITGPTGSGKTTTVYSVLKRLHSPSVNIITIEDPVEKFLTGVNQVQVNTKSGLTFAAGLRSILRQDPDIVMIGEIRDSETASIGARAAITGHLVIATMHTNDAPSAFMRLMDMDVEPYIVASSVMCVVAQRLVRKICKYCKEEYKPTEEELYDWEGELPEKFYRGRGCPVCNNSGYLGRIGVYEIIYVDSHLKKMIMEKADSEKMKAYLIEHNNMKDLGDNVQFLTERGITTLEEMRKIKHSVE